MVDGGVMVDGMMMDGWWMVVDGVDGWCEVCGGGGGGGGGGGDGEW